MKTVTIEGEKYKIRTLPLETAPEVFETVQKMFAVANQIVKESAEPVPKDGEKTLKVFMAILNYTQEKLGEAKFFREHQESLDLSSGGFGSNIAPEADEASEVERK